MSRPAHPQPSGDPPAPSAPAVAEAPAAVTVPRTPAPLDPPMLPFAVGGTVLWGLLALAQLPFRHTLVDQGRGSWLWICLAGVLIGLPGVATMVKYDAGRRRRRAAANQPAAMNAEANQPAAMNAAANQPAAADRSAD